MLQQIIDVLGDLCPAPTPSDFRVTHGHPLRGEEEGRIPRSPKRAFTSSDAEGDQYGIAVQEISRLRIAGHETISKDSKGASSSIQPTATSVWLR